ncbi:MAG: excinuclease ABC subunit UvrB, partial [Candidatus Shapirobacteria bacterium]
MSFQINSSFEPSGDQPQAINKLVTNLNNGINRQTLLGVTGSGKSLTYDEPILLYEAEDKIIKSKLIPIGKIVDAMINSPGDKKYSVPSINPNSLNLELKPITNYLRHNAPKTLFEVETKSGRKVKVTGDHNFYVLRNGKIKLLKTKNIDKNDFIPIPRKISGPIDDLKKISLMEWLPKKTYFHFQDIKKYLNSNNESLIISNFGHQKWWRIVNQNESILVKKLPLISFANIPLDNIKIFSKLGSSRPLYQDLNPDFLWFLGIYIAEGCSNKKYLMLSIHEEELKQYFIKKISKLKIKINERKLNPGDFQINDILLSKIFSQWCGCLSGEKHLPPWFLSISNKQLGHLLSAIYDGDGSVEANEISLTSKSPQLISEISYALLRFGIIGRINKTYKRATNSDMKKCLYYRISISGKDNFLNFNQNIGFNSLRKQKILTEKINENKKVNSNVDLIPICCHELKKIIKSLKLSQSQIAEKIGCSRSQISFLESGIRKPSYSLLLKLIKIFNQSSKNKITSSQIIKMEKLTHFFWCPIKKITPIINHGQKYVYDISVIDNETFLAGFGGLFVHNTFTIANVIQQTQLPTLVISHNKTLAGQLYQEFKELFPNNKVSYFVSYYDYYQPEAYIPASDTYIAKEVQINDLIDRLRLEAASNLLSGKDNIIIASVSCIYNIGDPTEFANLTLDLKVGNNYPRRQLFESFISLYYTRSEMEFKRSTFRVRGETIEIWPSYTDSFLSLEFQDQTLIKIIQHHPFTAQEKVFDDYKLFPAKQYVSGEKNLPEVFANIKKDCAKQVEMFKKQGKILEAHRIEQRVEYDLEMLQETGYINGIENYSIYFDKNRKHGDPPYTLVDYFRHLWGDNFLTVIDESHVTVPQIGGMYAGDFARKTNLIDFGFRLPSALDNRPLKFTEFNSRVSKVIYVSATPSVYEINDSKNQVAEQIIRPTGLIDPSINIRPSKNQIPNLIEEIKTRVDKKERTLVVTLTKRMAEDLSNYLSDSAKTGTNLKVAYLHSDIETLERSKILDDLRSGNYDVLVGINLLREGLDLPEVSLVAILDADQQGFLRSKSSLIQIMGRASRHVDGQVILYADSVSDAMDGAIKEVNRRRLIQLKYNQDNNIIPKSVVKCIRPQIIEMIKSEPKPEWSKIDVSSLTPPQKLKHIKDLKKQMR